MAIQTGRDPITVTLTLPATTGFGWDLPAVDLSIILPWYYRGLTVDQVRRIFATAFRGNESAQVAEIVYGGYRGTRTGGDTRPEEIADAVRGLHRYAVGPRGKRGRVNEMAAVRQFLHRGHPTLSLAGAVIRRGDYDDA